MGKLFHNRLLDAVAKTLIVYVVIHWIALFLILLREKDFAVLNVFSILDFDKIWPSLGTGTRNTIFSFLFAALIFLLVILFGSRSGRKDRG